MKMLNGSELAGFIKERQAKEARRLKQSLQVQPKLAIIQVKDDPVINTYVRLKKRYGDDIGVDVAIYKIDQSDLVKIITTLNEDDNVHGMIVQLPLVDTTNTDRILNMVNPLKDVDGLAVESNFEPATPTAINWLLAGYNIDLANKNVLVIGQGKLVGAPLTKMMKDSGINPETVDKPIDHLKDLTLNADVIVSATGAAGLIKSDMVKPGTVVVDAGTATSGGVVKGDVADEVFEREDLVLTPKRGGVGPLTVCALFENVLKAARK